MSLMSRLLAMRANRGNHIADANKKVDQTVKRSLSVYRNIYVSKTGTAHRPGCRYWHDENLHTEDEVNADLENLNWGNCCRLEG